MPVSLVDIVLPQNPDQAMEAVTKQYVDGLASGGNAAYAADLTSAATQVVTHGLGTTDVIVSVYRKSDGAEFGIPYVRTSANSVTLDSVSSLSGYRVVVIAKNGTPSGGIDQDTADARYVNVGGDTMTAPLVLPGNPSSALQAAPKQYIDARTPQVTVASTAPSNPAVNDLWVDTT